MPKKNGLLGAENGRHSFAETRTVLDYPDFLGVQLKSFEDFVQADVPPEEREDAGLQTVFQEHFPITDSRERYTLEFIHYGLDAPKHSVEECIAQGLSFSVPLKAKLRLSSREDEDEDEAEEAIEQEVYLGNLPAMTDRGTFIINGAERVVVSQLHRSPGVFFGSSVHPNGTQLFSARVIPFRGSWIEFSTDVKDVMWAYIDRKKKLPVTTLLRALGFSDTDELVGIFDLADEVSATNKRSFKKAVGRRLAASVTVEKITEIIDEDTGEVMDEQKEREVLLPADHEITEADYDMLKEIGIPKVFVLRDEQDEGALDSSTLIKTLQKDPTHSEEEALNYLYLQLRGSEAPDKETARGVLERLFFSEKRYDLGDVGRYRINKRLKLGVPADTLTLTREDIIAIIKELIALKNSNSGIDDIDHLGNRRVRTVGEQLGSQFSLGLARMARTIKERMNLRDAENFTPQDLVNARTVSSVINTFFGTNQLSQFMDQTNPLAELTHKRRMSALGPGGLTRERAGFEVRDVHYTHYGRLCPIETPEGPNIGLISSLCVHAKINDFGFIETPYRVVKNGKVTTTIEWLSAEEEDNAIIAQANAPIDEKGNFQNDLVRCRDQGDFPMMSPKDIHYMDIAPNQIVSPSASLIPFLEHDDANRALMGSNMQRQSVPLLRAEAPIVGTGLEHRVARDSRAVVVAEGSGVVEYVDAKKIVIRYDEDEDGADVTFEEPVKEYFLTKFRRTNQDTCVNQTPIVKVGQRVGSLLLGRLRDVDIRNAGSGNAGGTNALRTQGLKFAMQVVLFDVGKGALAAWIGLRFTPGAEDYSGATAHGYAAAFAAVLGHVWPLWHGFRGGKGAATLVGGVMVLWPWVSPLLLAVWMATILATGYVGLATVLAGASLALAAWWTESSAPRLWFACAAAALLIFSHRANIGRLLRGEESRFQRARLLHRLWRHRGS